MKWCITLCITVTITMLNGKRGATRPEVRDRAFMQDIIAKGHIRPNGVLKLTQRLH